ncbi:MAG: L,D-transpeptidase [Patescibacteria group bacterium]
MAKNKYQISFWYIIILFFGVIFFAPKISLAVNTIVPEVKIFSDSQQVKSFYGFDLGFRGGVRVASGDVDGDNVDEIIVGAGAGGGPNVQIFKGDGKKIKSFLAYDRNFRKGIKVAACDIDNDNVDEIITAPGQGGGPNVKIFKADGTQLLSFMAYGSSFRGGVNVACGDIIGDSQPEIVTGPGIGGGPQVRVFNASGQSLNLDIWPFEFKHQGGVNVAVGNFTGDFKMEIAVTVQKLGKPVIEVYDNLKNKIAGFYAFNSDFHGGVNLAAGDLDVDGFDEIIAAAGDSGGPQVIIFKYNGKKLPGSFFPYPKDFKGGVFPAAGDVNGDLKIEVVTGPGFMPDTRYSYYQKYLDVNLTEQKLSLYENGVVLGVYTISSGKPGMDTPQGIFKVMSKSPNAYSKKYALYMPYWMQFTGQGHGLHGLPYWKLRGGGVIKEGVNHLGIRVSHGCVRLSWEAAEKVYNEVEIGTPVIVHS